MKFLIVLMALVAFAIAGSIPNIDMDELVEDLMIDEMVKNPEAWVQCIAKTGPCDEVAADLTESLIEKLVNEGCQKCTVQEKAYLRRFLEGKLSNDDNDEDDE